MAKFFLSYDEIHGVNYPRMLKDIGYEYSEDVANQFREIYDVTVPLLPIYNIQEQVKVVKEANTPTVVALRDDIFATLGPEAINLNDFPDRELRDDEFQLISVDPLVVVKQQVEYDECVEFRTMMISPVLVNAMNYRSFPYGNAPEGSAHVILNFRYEKEIPKLVFKMLGSLCFAKSPVTILIRGYRLPKSIEVDFRHMFSRLDFYLDFIQWGRWFSTDYLIQTVIPLNVKKKKSEALFKPLM